VKLKRFRFPLAFLFEAVGTERFYWKFSPSTPSG
jgi:hypothetical protein